MVAGDRNFARNVGHPPGRMPGPGEVSFLEQTLWRLLTGDGDRDKRIAAWLSLLATTLDDVQGGVVVLRQDGDGGPFVPIASWPADIVVSAELAAAAEKVLQSGRGTVLPRPGQDAAVGETADMALPVTIGGATRGVVAVTVGKSGTEASSRTFRQLQWGAAWIREILLGADLDHARHVSDKAANALRVLTAALEEERIEGACRSLVTLLAENFACERVSVGFVRRGHVEVAVVSHTAEFSERLNLIHMLGDAMDEAVDQHAHIVFPPPAGEPLVTRAHDALARKHRASAILTVPLFTLDRFAGAITFERTAEGATFLPREVEAIEFVAAFAGVALEEKRANDRPLAAKAWSSLKDQLAAVFGPRHLGRKLVLLAVAAASLYFYVATAEYRVVANARIEGSVQRTIAAPFDGIIRDVGARPGDVVEDKAQLVSFDDRELLLERLRWTTERDKQRSEYDRALGERSRADVRIISARIEQANAQIELTEEKIARATLSAPFAAVVISGDLSQRIGGAVRRGETLMEIAPLTSYRVVLNIDESQIEHVRIGDTGELIASSLPDTAFPIRLTKIIPVSHIADGKNVFSAEAEVIRNSEHLRPGMTGIGKVDAGERLVIWVWARSFIDWLRLFVWRWTP